MNPFIRSNFRNPQTYLAFFIFCFLSCENRDADKISLTVFGDGVAFNIDGELDMDKTASCGTATPYSSSSTSTTTTTTTSTSTTNLYTVITRLYFKTGEYLYLKFLYDATQNQGSIDSTQGFSYSGGIGTTAVVSNYGKIYWGGSGVPVDTSVSSSQALSYLTLDLDLVGTAVSSGSVALSLTQCYTVDNINCTSATSTSMCYTQDGATCYNTQNVSGPSVSIKGEVNCTSSTVSSGSSSNTSTTQ
ncbi:LIC10920 family plasminogen-binding lipoprotein [Leptospira venezuelensis]|uniref:LIC10920 family plasminogen-binding lipoprotein n=1 Tax=Leptospira venezuelensis TaxID=1958811 RepID=UPI000A36D46E|nr:hypothetical protein [Leptospira venezuelensis]